MWVCNFDEEIFNLFDTLSDCPHFNKIKGVMMNSENSVNYHYIYLFMNFNQYFSIYTFQQIPSKHFINNSDLNLLYVFCTFTEVNVSILDLCEIKVTQNSPLNSEIKTNEIFIENLVLKF